jgi:hypothetical protein
MSARFANINAPLRGQIEHLKRRLFAAVSVPIQVVIARFLWKASMVDVISSENDDLRGTGQEFLPSFMHQLKERSNHNSPCDLSLQTSPHSHRRDLVPSKLFETSAEAPFGRREHKQYLDFPGGTQVSPPKGSDLNLSK